MDGQTENIHTISLVWLGAGTGAKGISRIVKTMAINLVGEGNF